SNAHPSVPRLGGRTVTEPSFPAIVALIWKTPAFSLICAPLTGPFSPFASLYLKPFTASPLQKGLDVVGLVPVGRVYVWLLSVPPLTWTVRVPPFVTGSPTIVSSLASSFALTVIFRFSGVLGFFTINWSPSTFWLAACVVTGRSNKAASTRRDMGTP